MRSDYSSLDPAWTSASPCAMVRGERGVVAFVGVEGPVSFDMPAGMERYSPYFGSVHGGVLCRTLADLAARADVAVVALDVHCPGGSAFGVHDIISAVSALKAAGKRVVAIAHDQACSLAMLLMALADEACATPTATLGSIGTRLDGTFFDVTEKLARDGIKAFNPAVGQLKTTGMPGAPLSDEAKAALQRWVEGVSQPFLEAVATGRGIGVDSLKALDGAVLSAPDALKAGLIDRIVPFHAWRASLLGRSDLGTSGVEPTEPPDPEDSADIAGAKESPMSATPTSISTIAALTAAFPALVAQIQEETRAAAAEPAASLDQLQAAFGAEPQFVLDQLKAKATFSAALKSRHDALAKANADLSARVKDLEEQLKAKGPHAGPRGAAGVPVAPAASGNVPAPAATFADAVRAAMPENGNSIGRAMLAAARKQPALFSQWQREGRPSIEVVVD